MNDETRNSRRIRLDDDALSETRPHRPIRPDLDETSVHPPVPAQADTIPDWSTLPPPVTAPPLPPPTYVPPKQVGKRRRRTRLGCMGQMIRLGTWLAVMTTLFLVMAVLIYLIFPPSRVNILVLGVDARPGESYVTRSDTIMLATVDSRQPYIGILSVPRDLYVSVPGRGSMRINAAHVYGESEGRWRGAELMAQTVANNFEVPVHRTLRMNFRGFVAIVDAAGGVDIDVPGPLYDPAYPTEDYGTMTIYFDAGLQHMNGERALQYARTRHTSNDFMRAARQQQVMVALMRQLVNPANWWRIPDVYAAVMTNVESDMTVFDIALLAPAILRVGPDGVDHRVMSRENSMVYNAGFTNDPYLLAPNWPVIDPVVEEMFRR